MRRITFTAFQFQNFVFPYVGAASAKDMNEWETQLNLIKKLKDPALTAQIELSAEEELAMQRGQAVYAFYRLREEQATFSLEDDEWRMLKRRIEENRSRVNAVAAEDYQAVWEAVEDPAAVDITVPMSRDGA